MELREQMSAEAAAAAGEAPSLGRVRAHAAAVRRLARRHGASNVRVFGSVARGDAGPASDYDVVVDLDPDLRGFEAFYRLDELERGLAALLDRPVHVVTARHLSDFTRRVLRDAVPV